MGLYKLKTILEVLLVEVLNFKSVRQLPVLCEMKLQSVTARYYDCE